MTPMDELRATVKKHLYDYDHESPSASYAQLQKWVHIVTTIVIYLAIVIAGLLGPMGALSLSLFVFVGLNVWLLIVFKRMKNTVLPRGDFV